MCGTHRASACSIMGYCGTTLGKFPIYDGLLRMQYHGYDSAGIACIDHIDGTLVYRKGVGMLADLHSMLCDHLHDGYVGIGHIRWATHGTIAQHNAHPFVDCTKKYAIVHKGIISNYRELRAELEQQGHSFTSQTDSEVLVHLIEQLAAEGVVFEDFAPHIAQRATGAYGVIVLAQDRSHSLLVIRNRITVCMGSGPQGNWVASDYYAFCHRADNLFFMPDQSYALVTADTIVCKNFNGQVLPVATQRITQQPTAYEYHTLYAIYHQKEIMCKLLELCAQAPHELWQHLGMDDALFKKCKKIVVVADAQKERTAHVAQAILRSVTGLSIEVVVSDNYVDQEDTLVFALDDSVHLLHAQAPVVQVHDIIAYATHRSRYFMPTLDKDAVVRLCPVTLVVLYWLAHYVAQQKNMQQISATESLMHIMRSAAALENIIEHNKLVIVQEIAACCAQAKSFGCLGVGVGTVLAQEMQEQLREQVQKPAAVLTVDDQPFVVPEIIFVFSSADASEYHQVCRAAEQLHAAGARIIAVALYGQDELAQIAQTVFWLPPVEQLLTPVAMSGIMQFLVKEMQSLR